MVTRAKKQELWSSTKIEAHSQSIHLQEKKIQIYSSIAFFAIQPYMNLELKTIIHWIISDLT